MLYDFCRVLRTVEEMGNHCTCYCPDCDVDTDGVTFLGKGDPSAHTVQGLSKVCHSVLCMSMWAVSALYMVVACIHDKPCKVFLTPEKHSSRFVVWMSTMCLVRQMSQVRQIVHNMSL